MNKVLLLLAGICLLTLTILVVPNAPTEAQGNGISVTCDDGTSFENGIEIVVVQMRSGFSYTATAVGLNGFDPVLAVLDESGQGLCTDDDPAAAAYSANLPSTGPVPSSGLSSQVRFDQNSASDFADVSLVVGGYNNTPGEFVLILEGMAVTEGDGAGDPFAIQITPGMIASGVPLSVYMVSITNQLDPLMYQHDGNYNLMNDTAGVPVICDDAGNANNCWGQSLNMSNSYVSRSQGRQLGGYGFDAMLNFPLTNAVAGNFINLVMTSYEQQSLGQYVIAFHAGIGDSGATAAKPSDQSAAATPVPPTPVPPANTGDATGVSVTCDNGASFDNGVEIIVNQMRSGFTYTATAVGINGFDPVLAVLDSTGQGLCTDDDSIAARYSANLPTTGPVPASNLSSQVRFDQNSASAFDDVSLVVGGFGNSEGEFILILEGMGVTDGDGAGDPFSVRLTPGMVASGTPLTVYMISRDTNLDPIMGRIDANFNVINDEVGNPIACDDSGNANNCWGTSFELSPYSVGVEQGQLPGYGRDSMLTMPLSSITLDPNPDFNFINLLMTSYEQQTRGQYVLVFHASMAAAFQPST